MELMVNRDVFTEDSTLGQLFINDEFECYSLEGLFREIAGEPVETWKVPGKTAIPLGRYEVRLELSPRFGYVTPHLIDVPGFTSIEIHPGNTQADTEGCILVGTQRDADSVSNSRIAFTGLLVKLKAVPSDETIYITVA